MRRPRQFEGMKGEVLKYVLNKQLFEQAVCFEHSVKKESGNKMKKKEICTEQAARQVSRRSGAHSAFGGHCGSHVDCGQSAQKRAESHGAMPVLDGMKKMA
uniref:Uncharacterized protein n=1 Tax=Eutreptiella gymnastica TaxID=73025 RepID=A0A7S1IUS0_9EUGL